MAKQTINIGASPNDGTGTPLRTAFDYTNQNFTELYTATGPSGNNIVVPGSATITGDLTVDTSTLKVDSTNNRVGIVNASPTYPLDVVGTGRFVQTNFADNIFRISTGGSTTGNINQILFADQATTATSAITAYNSAYGSGKNYALSFTTNGSERYLIDSTGVSTWAVGGTTAMTLNSTGLGVGVVPSAARFEIGGQDGTQFYIRSTGTNPARIRGFTNATEAGLIGFLNGGGIYFDVSGERMRIDTSGNVGIGVTPSAWDSGFQVIENSGGSLWSGSTGAVRLSQNAYYATSLKYKNALAASQYVQTSGQHQWFNAPSGTAGNAITFTQAMTLDASGNLLLACTSAPTGSTSGFYFDATHYAYFSRSAGETLNLNRYTSTGATAKFRYAGTEVGDISVTGAGTTYNSTSDYRLKESVAPLSGGLARVSALKPSIYKWKSDGSSGEGFLAHELAEVVPAAVTGEKDAVNEDGSIKSQGVDMSRVVPILVAAIQELTARVQTLEAK